MPKPWPFHSIMDSSAEFVDLVKSGKAKAAIRYRRTRQFKTLMHVLEACVTLFVLLSWCSGGGLSLAVDSTVDHSLRLLHLLRRPLSVFLLSNGIIAVIVLLSRTDDRKNKTGAAADFSDRIYDEYIDRRGTTQVASVRPLVPEKSLEETSKKNLQIVPYVAEPTKSIEPEVSRVSSTPNIRAAEEGERNCRRTRSALAVRSCRQEHDRALRRSMTEIGRGKARCGPSRRSVDDLSNEEFNQTVENYIARTRWFLQRELVADLTVVPKESHCNSNMAVTVRN